MHMYSLKAPPLLAYAILRQAGLLRPLFPRRVGIGYLLPSRVMLATLKATILIEVVLDMEPT